MLRRRGQSTLEYLTVIIIILAAFLTVGTYFKRGVQGRWKAAVDEMGDQYDPRNTNADVTRRIEANTVTTISTVPAPGGVWTLREDVTNTIETQDGFIRVGAF